MLNEYPTAYNRLKFRWIKYLHKKAITMVLYGIYLYDCNYINYNANKNSHHIIRTPPHFLPISYY